MNIYTTTTNTTTIPEDTKFEEDTMKPKKVTKLVSHKEHQEHKEHQVLLVLASGGPATHISLHKPPAAQNRFI